MSASTEDLVRPDSYELMAFSLTKRADPKSFCERFACLRAFFDLFPPSYM